MADSWTPRFGASDLACRCGCGYGSNPADVSAELLERLERACAYLGWKPEVTSGCRCPARNAMAGGSRASAHMTGEAADLKCPDSRTRFALMSAAFQAGFRRIGIERGCVHLDVSRTLPQPVAFFWGV